MMGRLGPQGRVCLPRHENGKWNRANGEPAETTVCIARGSPWVEKRRTPPLNMFASHDQKSHVSTYVSNSLE